MFKIGADTTMTNFKHINPKDWRGLNNSLACTGSQKSDPVQVSIAKTFSDFMDATPLLRKAATDSYAPIAPDEIGRFLSRLNHGGNGRDTGCVVIARIDNKPVGFAVLLPVGDDVLELTWLHSGDNQSDLVFDALWDKAAEVKDAWDVRYLQVGFFAPRPTAPAAHGTTA
jgi:hypothetical protein